MVRGEAVVVEEAVAEEGFATTILFVVEVEGVDRAAMAAGEVVVAAEEEEEEAATTIDSAATTPPHEVPWTSGPAEEAEEVEEVEETMEEEGSIDAVLVDASLRVVVVDSKAESLEEEVEEEGGEEETICFREEDAAEAGDDRIEEEGVSATNLVVEGVTGKEIMVATIATLLLATTTV